MRVPKDKTMRCFLIEDEPLAVKQIEKYIASWDELIYLGYADDIEIVDDLIPFINRTEILFIDIKVSGGDISALAPYISSDKMIVVTSAFPKENYPEFLRQRAIDCLQKPITMDQFDICIYKILKLKSIK
jgi:two-component system LytT family response regulator